MRPTTASPTRTGIAHRGLLRLGRFGGGGGHHQSRVGCVGPDAQCPPRTGCGSRCQDTVSALLGATGPRSVSTARTCSG